MRHDTLLAGLTVLTLTLAGSAAADTKTIISSRDTTIYSEAGDVSNGAGIYMFAGPQIRQISTRAALIRFDLAAAGVPANATITAARLTLTVSRSASGDEPVTVHRLLADWGEAGSDAGTPGGQGAEALPGDATWTHAFYSTVPWPVDGFIGFPPSATRLVGGVGSYTWPSTADTVADVQTWLRDPARNFGWIIIGNEEVSGSAKRFNTREHPTASTRPTLVVEYTLPGCPADYNRDTFLNLDDLGDFITDFYTAPAIPGGVQPSAPSYADQDLGFGAACPAAGNAPAPYASNAYRVSGFRVGFSPDGSNSCPFDPAQPFPNLDNLNDFITAYYAAFTGGC